MSAKPMSKSERFIYYTSLEKRLEKLKYLFAGAVGVVFNIRNKINLRIVYMNINAKLGVAGFNNNCDLCVHTVDSANDLVIF